MKNMLCLLLALLAIGAGQAQPVPADNTLFRHIPADANQVFQVNLGLIGSKVDLLSLFMLSQKLHLSKGNSKQFMDMKLMLDAGIDFHQDIIIAKTTADPDSILFTTLLVNLSDSGKFAASLHSMGKFHFLHEQGKQRIAADSFVTCAWNDHQAVILIAALLKSGHRTTAWTARYHSISTRRSLDALHGFTTSYFATDPIFNAEFSAGADIQLWNKSGGPNALLNKFLAGKVPMAQLNAFSQMRPHTSHSPTFSAIRFEPGKITYRILKPGSAEEKANMLRFAGPPLSNALTARIPAGELLGLAAIHFNIPALMDTVDKAVMADTLLMKKLKSKDLSSADVIHAIKGEFLVLAFNPDKNTPVGMPASKTPVLYLAASVDDSTAFAKLAAKLKWVDAALTPPADTTTDTTHHGPFHYYTIQNGLAVIGATPRQTMAWFNHPSAAPDPIGRLLPEQVRSNSFSAAIDMQSAADMLTSVMTKGDTLATKDKAVVTAIRQMDAILFSSSAVEENGLASFAELRFTDQDKNGLASLMGIISSLAH